MTNYGHKHCLIRKALIVMRCGPQDLLYEVQNALLQNGFSTERLRFSVLKTHLRAFLSAFLTKGEWNTDFATLSFSRAFDMKPATLFCQRIFAAISTK